MKSLLLLLVVAFVGFLSVAAQKPATSPKPAASTGPGEIVDGKFVSKRYGVTLSIPESYTVVSAAEAELLADAGNELMKQGTASEKKIDEAIGRTIRLLVIAEHPIGTPKNAALEMATVKQAAGVTARMSLVANVNLLKGTPFVFKRNLGTLRLGANNFAAAEFEATFGETAVKQRMYIVMHRGYSLSIAVTYATDEQLAAMEKVMGTIVLTR